MWVFLLIALIGLIVFGVSSLFGHDHDITHEHDVSHVGGVSAGEATASLFSPKVLGALLMGFGAAGAISRAYNPSNTLAAIIGLGSGMFTGIAMWWLMTLLLRQQSNSQITTQELMNQKAVVVVAIEVGSVGEIGLEVGGRYVTHLAVSDSKQALPKNTPVIIRENRGGKLSVEKI